MPSEPVGETESPAERGGFRAAVPPNRPSRPGHGRRFRIRNWILGLLGVVLILVLAGLWLAFRAHQMQQALTAAQRDVVRVRTDVDGTDWAVLSTDTHALRKHAAAAANAARDPIWGIGEHLPWAGTNLRVAAVVATSLDQIARSVDGPLANSHTVAALQSHDKRMSDLVDAVSADSPSVTSAAAVVDRATQRIDALHTAGLWSSIRSRIIDAQSKIDRAQREIDDASVLSTAVPQLLGKSGSRTILLVFQSPAEPRGTDGLIGAWGELHAVNGSISLVRFGPNDDLPTLTSYPAGVSADISRLYGEDPLLPLDANLSSSFPDAARLIAASWTAGPGAGAKPDAIVSIDPVALGQLLSVVGPVRAGGITLTASNAADVLLRQEYYMFQGAEVKPRIAFLGEVTKAVFSRITAGGYSTAELVKQLSKMTTSGRLTVWSPDDAQEGAWRSVNVAGDLGAPSPSVVRMAVNSADASKLAGYLHTSVTVRNCASGGPTLSVALASSAPANPPPYVGSHLVGVPATTMRLIYSAYIDPSWGVRRVTIDGQPVKFSADTEAGWRLLRVTVDVPRAAARSIGIELVAPHAVGSAADAAATAAPAVQSVKVVPQSNAVTVSTDSGTCASTSPAVSLVPSG